MSVATLVAAGALRTAEAVLNAAARTGDTTGLTGRIVDALRRKFEGPGDDPLPYEDLRNVARRAVRSRNAAGQLQDDPGRRVAGDEFPRDESVPRDNGAVRYRYRTIVVATGPDGREYRTPVDVDSTRPLTGEEVANAARSNAPRQASPNVHTSELPTEVSTENARVLFAGVGRSQ